MPKGDNPPPAHLTRMGRQVLRDQIAMRVLPFCCLEANRGCEDCSLTARAERAVQHAYLIADAMLSQRGIDETSGI